MSLRPVHFPRAFQANGNILVAGGFRLYGSTGSMFIAEVSSTGGLVTSFGSSGYASDSASADAVATPYGMALQSDGQIVLVGIGTDFDSVLHPAVAFP